MMITWPDAWNGPALAAAGLILGSWWRGLLERGRLEHQVRFTKLYERRFEVAEDVWGKLVVAERLLRLPASPEWRGMEQHEADFKRFSEAASEFRDTFNRSAIHFSTELNEMLEAYWGAMLSAGTWADLRASKHGEAHWFENFSKAAATLAKLRPKLEQECRHLLEGSWGSSRGGLMRLRSKRGCRG